ncbi:hypothetical protein HDU85_007239, partial [Gaertneriomyces sp. JEL0708]
VLRYGLISCHEKLAPAAENGDKEAHERTSWVDNVVPWMSPLRITGLVTWRWCEYGYTAKTDSIEPDDAYQKFPCKYGDGVGEDPGEREEIIVMESSGNGVQENVEHNMEDFLKLIESATFALKHFMQKRKDASFETMRQRGVMSIQLVKDRITLCKTVLGKDGKNWEMVELRSALLPRSWRRLGNVIKVAELVATMYAELREQRRIRQQVEDEVNGLHEPINSQDTVRFRLNWL